MQKIKYITNRELLAEIQRSKATFCHFTAPEYAQYDAIVTNTESLTSEFIAATLEAKLTRMIKQGLDAALTEADVVFRVMSDGHLPEECDERRRRKSSSGGWIPRTNFPPFQHFVLHEDILIEVGRSHWQGDLESGQFSTMHGRITDRLASMFLLLVDRFSRGGSWRGYCVDQSTEALTQRGWLGIDEINENDMILSYDQGRLKWSRIKSIYRGDYEGKMFHLTSMSLDALVTPQHKFITDRGLKPVELLRESDKLILMGDPIEDGPGTHDDAFVELVGWFVTEGNIYVAKDRNYMRVTIYQNEGETANRIRSCMQRLNEKHGEYGRPSRYDGGETIQLAFSLRKALSKKLIEVAPDRVLSMSFILSLTQAQRKLLIATMVDGDGWRTSFPGRADTHATYWQENKAHVDMFIALCTLAGYRTRTELMDSLSFDKQTKGQIYRVGIYAKRYHHPLVEYVDFNGGKRNGQAHPGRGKEAHPNEPTVNYKGRVWCPETEFGTFIARRNGKVFANGNSYVQDMRGQALVQLTQVGLQFDESRSDNPFAWYTQIVKNVFRRILLLEKRNQDIRDDLLIMAGSLPSYTRQVDDELEYKTMDQTEPEVREKRELKKRGRKPRPKI